MLEGQPFVWVGRDRLKNSSLHRCPSILCTRPTGFCRSRSTLSSTFAAPTLKRVFARLHRLLSRWDMYALAQRIVRSMATSIRLAEHESEGHNEELIALIIADMQDPVTPIREAALAG
jgi:hypothetical protein